MESTMAKFTFRKSPELIEVSLEISVGHLAFVTSMLRVLLGL